MSLRAAKRSRGSSFVRYIVACWLPPASLSCHFIGGLRPGRPAGHARHHLPADRQAGHPVGRISPAASRRWPRSRCARASRASSTSCISATASSSRPAICCSPSTSGRSRSPSRAPRPRSRATRRRSSSPRPRSSAAQPLVRSRTITDARVRPAQGQPRRRAGAAQGRRGGDAQSPSSTSNGPRCARRIAGRISDRKVDAGNLISGGQQGATLLATIVTLDPIHFVFDVSESGLSALHAPVPVRRRVRIVARRQRIPVRIRLADETEWTRTRQDGLRRQPARTPAPGTIRGRAIFENKDQLADARHLRPPAAVRRRVRRAADPRLRDRLRPGAQDRVHGRAEDNVVRPKPVDARTDASRACASSRGPDSRPTVVIDGLANPMVRPGVKVAPQTGEIKAADA